MINNVYVRYYIVGNPIIALLANARPGHKHLIYDKVLPYRPSPGDVFSLASFPGDKSRRLKFIVQEGSDQPFDGDGTVDVPVELIDPCDPLERGTGSGQVIYDWLLKNGWRIGYTTAQSIEQQKQIRAEMALSAEVTPAIDAEPATDAEPLAAAS